MRWWRRILSSWRFCIIILSAILAAISVKHGYDGSLRVSNNSNSTIKADLPLCRPLNTTSAKEKMTCLKECRPDVKQTIEGLGLSSLEKFKMKVRFDREGYTETHEFGKYRYHFLGKSALVLFYLMWIQCIQYEDSMIWILHLNLVCLCLTAFKEHILIEVSIVSLSTSQSQIVITTCIFQKRTFGLIKVYQVNCNSNLMLSMSACSEG